MINQILIAPALPATPYRVSELPLLAKLCRAAHHQYRKKWSKRLAKRPTRMAYDFARDVLKLGGHGRVYLGEGRRANFDARKPHFGNIYFGNEAAGYEPDVSALLASLLQGDKTFCDIGSNWGYFTFYAASLSNFTGPIHTFEPVPATRSDVIGLRDGFGLQDRITVHATALSSETGTVEMAVHDSETGLNRITGSGVGREGDGRETVPMSRFDDLGIAPDVIKMDVEDHEFEALSGATEALKTAKPFIIVESWLTPSQPRRTLRALELLESHGYDLYQPCWRVTTADGAVIFPELSDRLPGPDCKLALVPFPSEQRFMLSQQMNVFACPKDRQDDLTTLGFDQVAPTK
jgi:FkbM family methyltransferase